MKSFESKNTGLIVGQDLKKGSVKIFYWLTFVLLLFISFVCIFPPIWIFLSSFKDMKEFLSIPPTIFPKTFNLGKLLDV